MLCNPVTMFIIKKCPECRYVLGPDLAACARDLYHRYRDCKDADSYLAGETLHDVVLLPGDGNIVYAILACADCAVRFHRNDLSGALSFRLH